MTTKSRWMRVYVNPAGHCILGAPKRREEELDEPQFDLDTNLTYVGAIEMVIEDSQLRSATIR